MMQWGPSRAAAAAAAAAAVTLPSLLLLLLLLLVGGPQPSSAVRAPYSNRNSIPLYHPRGAPLAFVLGPLTCSSFYPRHSCSELQQQQQQQQRQRQHYVKAATATAAAAAAAAASGEEGRAPEGPPEVSLSEALDTAAAEHVKQSIAAAAAGGDGIVRISSKTEDETAAEAAAHAAAAAAGDAAATPEALMRSARTFDAANPHSWPRGPARGPLGAPHSGGPLGAPYGGGPYGGAPYGGGPLGGPRSGGPLPNMMGGPPGAPPIKPGGPLEALAVCMEKGLERGASWLRRWKQNEERVLPVLLSRLEENAAITLGQKTVVQLPEQQRMQFVEGMKELGAAAVILGYAEMDEGAAGAAAGAAARAAAAAAAASGDAAAAAAQQAAGNIVLVGFAAVAEPIDVRLLDTSGEVGLRIVGRVKVLGVQEANEQGFKVRAVPWWDERRGFTDPANVKEVIGALHSLVDRCNKLELKYRQLQRRFHQAHLVSLRPSLSLTVSEMLAELNNPTEEEIAETVSFCALDHHLDARTRCWANSQQDTEMRLDLARRAIEAKVKKLQAEIRNLKAIEEDPRAAAADAAAAAAAPPPHPAAPLDIHQEEPEDVYAGPPVSYE
ncbi:hypothetical protein, conserved [Eimeria acervulina]|uniref:Uncharacterized protein n=1 Tax=Eimeria acervulina TaxID=5801 RepID=U6GXD5_EIMAC|nr:hypothetical protein, conserved [Eimeria acervulina]CDI83194.1 hypothetical protein, conserved [Eimeria acervulina]